MLNYTMTNSFEFIMISIIDWYQSNPKGWIICVDEGIFVGFRAYTSEILDELNSRMWLILKTNMHFGWRCEYWLLQQEKPSLTTDFRDPSFRKECEDHISKCGTCITVQVMNS